MIEEILTIGLGTIMGYESVNTGRHTLVEKATKANYYNKEGEPSEIARPANDESILAETSAAASSEAKTPQPSALLVFETNQRFRAWYDHLEGRYFDSVVGYQDPETLVNAVKYRVNARCIILEIGKNRTTDTSFVEPILQNYPNADLIITVPKGSSHFFSDIVEYSARVKILERPFSMSNLVVTVRQTNYSTR